MSMIKGETGDWEIVLGLEVHAQVISDAKLFSGAPTTFGADPNTQVSLVDAAMPGMLPVINKRCADEAAAYLAKLRSIVRYLGTCDGNMDEGSMRCDINVSVRKPNGPLGTRCEIKNVNSIRFMK